jgi:hypothetical protein
MRIRSQRQTGAVEDVIPCQEERWGLVKAYEEPVGRDWWQEK